MELVWLEVSNGHFLHMRVDIELTKIKITFQFQDGTAMIGKFSEYAITFSHANFDTTDKLLRKF
ncbi:MAG: hypothetical protein AAB336_13555 [Acidobacteriota bacterium]